MSMNRYVKNVWIVPKRTLCSVTMMDVPVEPVVSVALPFKAHSPIQNEHFLRQTHSHDLLGGDRSVIIEAESHVFHWLGVVSRRANDGKRISDLTLADGHAGLDDATAGKSGAMGGLTADIERQLIVVMLRVLDVVIAQN